MGSPIRTHAEEIRLGLRRVRNATKINDHLGARITLAKLLKHERASKALLGLQKVYEVEMEMHDDMKSIEKRWTDHMLRWVEIHHPNLLSDIRKAL